MWDNSDPIIWEVILKTTFQTFLLENPQILHPFETHSKKSLYHLNDWCSPN